VPTITANGIRLAYETQGDPSDPPLLLVMGLGAQLIYWPDGFCSALTGRGFHVIRYDNRDVGLSQKIEGGPPPDLAGAAQGDTSSASYSLADMAADGIGLLDALGIGAAHVVGASMGGMIAQLMAIRHPERLLSLCSIMSAPTGVMAPDPPSPEATMVLMRPPATTREEAIEGGVAAVKVIGSPGYPFDEAYIRDLAARSFDRCFYPVGLARQLMAIVSAPPWVDDLAAVKVPTVVIHGDSDPLVRPSWGEKTAAAIPGATFVSIPGMGHDLPAGAWPALVDAIVANAANATK
jgi:pimeloyl-ACP methyl ester carboxylesterase